MAAHGRLLAPMLGRSWASTGGPGPLRRYADSTPKPVSAHPAPIRRYAEACFGSGCADTPIRRYAETCFGSSCTDTPIRQNLYFGSSRADTPIRRDLFRLILRRYADTPKPVSAHPAPIRRNTGRILLRFRMHMPRVSVYRCIGSGCADRSFGVLHGVSVQDASIEVSVYRCIGSGCADRGFGVSAYRLRMRR